MPQPYKGRRVRATVRLPIDLYAEAADRARARRWNMSDYIAWCVEQTVRPTVRRAGPPLGPPKTPDSIHVLVDGIKSGHE